MRSIRSSTQIKGDYTKNKDRYTYKDALIICKRKGSIIELKDDSVIINADITGIDKVYFKIKDDKIIISNVFKDFLDDRTTLLDEDFLKCQKSKGYVPYPFTIIKTVMKAPPGLITRIYFDKGKIRYSHEAGKDLKIFDVDVHFDKKDFKKTFTRILSEDAKGQKQFVSSFSGGFDSTFLTTTHIDKCKHLLHFSEDKKVDISRYKKIFQDRKWTVINNNEKFSEKDRIKYFKSIDEPCCDSAGFAEYLMIKRLTQESDVKYMRGIVVMNGQGCDGVFANGRAYFQEFIASRMPSVFRGMVSDKKYDSRIMSQIQNYSMMTKKRFMRTYIGYNRFSDEVMDEISKIYDIYIKNIRNDSTNIFAACVLMLKYSVHGIEKIKTAAHAFNIKYYLPFMSEDVMSFAFSIPARYKVGYSHGKKILIKSYPEIGSMKFSIGPFLPQRLKERLIGEKSTEERYQTYYIKNWTRYSRRGTS